MFHHLNIVPGLLAAALLLSAPVQAALPAYSAVKDEAKTVNKYMIVVWAGTDWSPKSREVTRAVEHLAKDSPEPVLWCIQDEREEMTEEEKKLPKPPGEIWNIPAIQVVSPAGGMVFLSGSREAAGKGQCPVGKGGRLFRRERGPSLRGRPPAASPVRGLRQEGHSGKNQEGGPGRHQGHALQIHLQAPALH